MAAAAQDPKENAQRFVDDVLNPHDLDRLDDLVAEDFLERTPRAGQAPGREGFREMLRGLMTGFPDARWQIEHLIGEGDTVVLRIVFTGTHLGPFMGYAPTGRPVRVSGVHIARVVDGMMVEHWRHVDELDLLDQLGLRDMAEPTAVA